MSRTIKEHECKGKKKVSWTFEKFTFEKIYWLFNSVRKWSQLPSFFIYSLLYLAVLVILKCWKMIWEQKNCDFLAINNISNIRGEFMRTPSQKIFVYWDLRHFCAIQKYLLCEIYGVWSTFIMFLYHTKIAGKLVTVQERNIRVPNESEDCSSHAPCNSGH